MERSRPAQPDLARPNWLNGRTWAQNASAQLNPLKDGLVLAGTPWPDSAQAMNTPICC